MGVAQKYAQSPEALKDVYVPAKAATGSTASTTSDQRHDRSTTGTGAGDRQHGTSATRHDRPARPT
jgi:multidrug efflux pump